MKNRVSRLSGLALLSTCLRNRWLALYFISLLSSPVLALPEGQGAYPIDEPRYEGVDRLLVLSDRWIVVVTSNTKAVLDEIDALSKGQFSRAVAEWEATRVQSKPKWQLRKVVSSLRDTYIAQARENAGERELSQPKIYQIKSDDDPNFGEGKVPIQVAGLLVGLGGARLPGAHDVDYAHYAYLELPRPMQRGKQYTVTVRGDASVSFQFDESHTVSRAVKVNQVGYLLDAPRKIAYLGAHLYSAGPLDCSLYATFEVVDGATGKVAHSGPIRLRDKNSLAAGKKTKSGVVSPPRMLHGEDLYELDFSSLKASGTFFIRIPGVGRSWPFRHGPDAYGEAFYTAARGLYHQRCGIACGAPFTAWERPLCHTEPVYESGHIAFPRGKTLKPEGYKRFDVIAATLDKSQQTEDVRGGWHDAADWDRGANHYTVIFDLLYAYELAPEKFTDGQLNIPESGNGIPDVLDEAEYGLKVWAKSMNAEGGVSGHVESWTHPRMDGDAEYAFSRRTRWDSLLLAAASAQLAQHLLPFDSKRSAVHQAVALKAYGYGLNPANSLGKVTIQAQHDRGRGEPYTLKWQEKEAYVSPYIVHAKVRLFRLTGDESYLKGMSRLLSAPFRPYVWPCSYADYSPWIFFSMLHGEEGFLPPFQRAKMLKEFFIDPADALVAELETMPYRHSWPRDKTHGLSWGAAVSTNPARALLIAYALTGDSKYRAAALQNMDFMFGGNPMGMSWTTGIGYVYPTDIQHEVSQLDGISDPVPGITLYGVTGGIYPALRNLVWASPGDSKSKEPVVFQEPDVPVWRRWSCHPRLNTAQCEFTIQETTSSTIFCAAMMLPDGWKPDEELRTRRPRNEADLHGRWYLP